MDEFNFRLDSFELRTGCPETIKYVILRGKRLDLNLTVELYVYARNVHIGLVAGKTYQVKLDHNIVYIAGMIMVMFKNNVSIC